MYEERWVYDQKGYLGELYKWREKNYHPKLSKQRTRSSFAKAGMSYLLDHVNDLPLSGISISASFRIRSLKKSMSFKLPTQLCRFSMNLVKLKSPIKVQGVGEYQA